MHNNTTQTWERPDRPTTRWAVAVAIAIAANAAIIAIINAGTNGLLLRWMTGGAL